MNFGLFRTGAASAMILTLVACGGGGSATSSPSPTPTPIDQAQYTKSFATYMTAAKTNFQAFSTTDHPLFASAECNVDHPGKDNAIAECRVATFDEDKNDARVVPKNARYEYDRQKAVFIKALPAGSHGAEQTDAVPNTPLRYAAKSGNSGAVLILTHSGSQWLVGYVFQKVNG